ncbi:hypothetical protein [Actinomadura sp. HBU206391]|uniref:hypothetical protein n=1 Tax=Actinomadura sp. HBU206391 TaxID=2731692 RepID=UPI001C9C6A25|nr:hypothetical protein [Actinomadura sp. HBU206391]
MPNAPRYAAFRTGLLWVLVGWLFLVLLVSLGWSWFSALEFDERCNQGIVEGPGQLQDIRRPAFPPAVICEYTQGEISAGGTGLLGAVMWLSLILLVLAVLLALLAECVESPAGARLTSPISRRDKLHRTSAVFVATAFPFLLIYGLAAWPLITGPSSSCGARGEWLGHPPKTLEYSLFPPQATCQYASGMTSELNPGWVVVLATALSIPMAIAGTSVVLAWHRRRLERRATQQCHTAPG